MVVWDGTLTSLAITPLSPSLLRFVSDGSGNTAIAGTLRPAVQHAVASLYTGATVLNGGLAMDTDKFTVADG